MRGPLPNIAPSGRVSAWKMPPGERLNWALVGCAPASAPRHKPPHRPPISTRCRRMTALRSELARIVTAKVAYRFGHIDLDITGRAAEGFPKRFGPPRLTRRGGPKCLTKESG